MQFIEPTLATITAKLNQITKGHQPLWGSMSAQRMIEHLCDAVQLSFKPHPFKLSIPEDKVDRAQAFLISDHPMPKNFKVEFAKEETPIRNVSIEAAIEELSENWNAFEAHFKTDATITTLHPSFGMLNYDLWLRLHSKHFTHHLEQFGIDA